MFNNLRHTAGTNRGGIWCAGVDQRWLLHAKFHSYLSMGGGVVPNCNFYEIFECKRPAEAYLLRDVYEIFRVYGQFLLGQASKFGNSLKGFRSYGDLTSAGAFPPNVVNMQRYLD